MTTDPSDLAGKAIDAARDVIAEPAKATTETARAASKAMDLVRDAGRIFGPAADELAAMMGDQMRYWRFLNAKRLSDKVDRLRITRNISDADVKLLTFSDAAKVLEAASMEDDEAVQDLWAELILDATNANGDGTVKKVFIDLLKSFSAPEVIFMQLLWECNVKGKFRSYHDIEPFNTEMNALAEEKWRKLPQKVRDTALQNLVRLRCITFRPKPINISGLIRQTRLEDGSRTTINNLDPAIMERLINGIFEMIQVSSGIKSNTDAASIPIHSGAGQPISFGARISVVEMNYLLTPMGQELMRSCSGKAPKNHLSETA